MEAGSPLQSALIVFNPHHIIDFGFPPVNIVMLVWINLVVLMVLLNLLLPRQCFKTFASMEKATLSEQ